MKILTVLICLSMSLGVFGQSDSTLQQFMETNYEGGYPAFIKQIYRTIRYPEKAMDAARIGKVLAKVYLTSDGEIEKITFLNRLAYDIDRAVQESILTTKKSWKKGGKARSFIVRVAFRIEGGPEISGDVNVTGAGAGRRITSSRDLTKKFNKYLKKEKYKKAKKVLDELLRRHPEEKGYHDFKTLLKNKKLKLVNTIISKHRIFFTGTACLNFICSDLYPSGRRNCTDFGTDVSRITYWVYARC